MHKLGFVKNMVHLSRILNDDIHAKVKIEKHCLLNLKLTKV